MLPPQKIMGERGVALLVSVFMRLAMGRGERTRDSPRGIVLGVATWADCSPSGGRVIGG